ncbi:MAG TPA: inositol monophosphatase family protein [Acidimicrobiales bacterium]|nr:inositol monophosphatase family protein [Acidimicrobiales bacterium]
MPGPDAEVEERAALADLAATAARRAGAMLLEGERSKRTAVSTKSSPTDMVSEMDRASEAAIRSLITSERPDDAILGEEGGQASGSTRVRWIVDPLDGTTNYLYGFPAWSVSVAAECDGAVVAGAVYDPIHDELFKAVDGAGATRNGETLHVGDRQPSDLSTALIGTGFAYGADRRAVQARWVAHVLPRVRDIRRAGSAALDLCWVAAGRLDGYYEQGTQIWDWAAGALIATEAGAIVGGFDGGPPSSDGLLAATPELAGPLRVLLAEARALAQ